MSEWNEKAEDCAKAKGLIVVRPAENEPFVDLDNRH